MKRLAAVLLLCLFLGGCDPSYKDIACYGPTGTTPIYSAKRVWVTIYDSQVVVNDAQTGATLAAIKGNCVVTAHTESQVSKPAEEVK